MLKKFLTKNLDFLKKYILSLELILLIGIAVFSCLLVIMLFI
jgi:hypothetical protein